MGSGASPGLSVAVGKSTPEEIEEVCAACSAEDRRDIERALRRVNARESSHAMVLCGPVVGTVTESTAHVLLEVDEDVLMTCTATPIFGGSAVSASVMLYSGKPGVFALQGLQPGTPYKIGFDPLANIEEELLAYSCCVRTMPAEVKKLRVVAVSCDWPDRLGRAENPWDRLAERCAAGDCDVMLHLGDQVYTWANGCTSAAMRVMDLLRDQPDAVTPVLRNKMEARAAQTLQESYRSTWHHPGIAKVLAQTSHLMIWSDNDVTNDFTVLRKPDGTQLYLPEYLQVAMGVYRMYQRQLWDPACFDGTSKDLKRCRTLGLDEGEVKEWHYHQYGPFGIFLMDMRGNRINPSGEIKENPILSDEQRHAIEEAFASPGLKCMLLCAEIPFVGEPPEGIKEKAKKLPFLKDHWPHQLEELTWLLDLCFSWRAAEAGREVVLLGGDIHISVESVIKDSETGTTLRHITTSPITNSVGKFWPALEGKINDRYSYTHKPFPGQRTFCALDLSLENDAATVAIELVCIPAEQETVTFD